MTRGLLQEITGHLRLIVSEVREINQLLIEEEGLIEKIPEDPPWKRELALVALTGAHAKLVETCEQCQDLLEELDRKEKETTS